MRVCLLRQCVATLFVSQAEGRQGQQAPICYSCAGSACKKTSAFVVHCFGMQTCKSLEPKSLVDFVPSQLAEKVKGLPYCGYEPFKLLLLELMLVFCRRYITQHWRTTAVSRHPAWRPWRAPPRMPLRCLASSPSVTTGQHCLSLHVPSACFR